MPFLDDLLAQQQYDPPAGARIGLRKGQAYSSFYNPVDVTAPAYITPNAYSLAQAGYRQNEFVYSIMQIRASVKAQTSLMVRDYANEKEQEAHALIKLLHNPNPAPHMTERLFWQMKQITQDIAGFAAFEIEYSNGGDPLALWYMTPYFCSFLRGQQLPLRAIRYQPYGLQPVDIPFKDEQGRTKILFFSNGENFDPLSDRVRFRSPMMAALPQVEIDNAMTFFLKDFVRNGAKFAGLISVGQTIDESQAADYRRRWRAQHGGAENWSDPLILGEGATYTSMQMNFRDMAFPELDARAESRICNAFSIDPIVANAKAGLDVSSYNNKQQAYKQWIYNWAIPAWKDDELSIGTQMLPLYHNDPENYYCEFDLTGVYALQEDRNAQVVRAVSMYEKKIATLNEARAEMGFDPAETDGDLFNNPTPPQLQPFAGGGADNPLPFDKQPAEQPKELTQAEQDAQAAEEKKFKTFARRRIKENKSADIPEYEFICLPDDRQNELLAEFGYGVKSDLRVLADAINAWTQKLETA